MMVTMVMTVVFTPCVTSMVRGRIVTGISTGLQNMECPEDVVFTNKYGARPWEGECVEYDKATQCKTFAEVPCLFSCPRVYLSSNGPALEHQYRRLGCFRLSGTLFGGTLVHN